MPPLLLPNRSSTLDARARMTAKDSGWIFPGKDGEAFPSQPQLPARQSRSGAWLITGLRFTLSPSHVFAALGEAELKPQQ
jgi:hypothetical protein